MPKNLLALWFWLSIFAVSSFVGLFLAHFNLFNSIVLGVISFIAVVYFGKLHPQLLVEYCAIAICLVLGGNIYVHNTFSLGTWISESEQELAFMTSSILGVNLFSHDLGTDFPTEFQIEKIQSLVVDNALKKRDILIGFNKLGLAILDGEDFTFISEQKTYILSAVLEDNTIFFYEDRSPVAGQELMKAKIIDKELHVIWRKPLIRKSVHHWADTWDGKIYHTGRDFFSLPNPISKKIGHKYATCDSNAGINDQIFIFDMQTGELEKQISLLPLLANYKHGEAMRESIRRCNDPLHTNNIRVLKNKKHAAYFPNGKVGDMLVSMRGIHSIMLLDANTYRVKWSVQGGRNGKFVMQHSPRVTNRGTIILFDNLGSDKENGRTRIVEIDIASKDTVGIYEAEGDEYFNSPVGGSVEIRNNRIWVNDSNLKKAAPYDPENVSLFYLECPDTYISQNCERTTIFKGGFFHNFNNTSLLH